MARNGSYGGAGHHSGSALSRARAYAKKNKGGKLASNQPNLRKRKKKLVSTDVDLPF